MLAQPQLPSERSPAAFKAEWGGRRKDPAWHRLPLRHRAAALYTALKLLLDALSSTRYKLHNVFKCLGDCLQSSTSIPVCPGRWGALICISHSYWHLPARPAVWMVPGKAQQPSAHRYKSDFLSSSFLCHDFLLFLHLHFLSVLSLVPIGCYQLK